MPPRKRQNATSSQLQEAVLFVSLITKDEGTIGETHLLLKDNQVTAFNGLIAAGSPIIEAIEACPNAHIFNAAISKCGQDLSFTLDEKKIAIKSNRFKANIPIVTIDSISTVTPDPNIAIVNDGLKDAFEFCAPLITGETAAVHHNALLIEKGTVISTTARVLYQYWHGIDLPRLALPKALADAVVRASKKLSGFGFSNNSATFWFEDQSWIKSQLFSTPYPDVWPHLSHPNSPLPLPVGLWDGLGAVAPFSEGLAYFDAGVIRSHDSPALGASYEVPALPRGPIVAIKQLLPLKDKITKADWFVRDGEMMYLFGEKVRCLIMGRAK